MKPDISEQELRNFVAFSKLYGYVRFFHPSDEAQLIDWNKFAAYGMMKVEESKDDFQLKESLLKLFRPIAPSIEIYEIGKDTNYDFSKIIPADTTGLQIVAWQHKGIELTAENVYKSVRLNRYSDPGNSFGTITNFVSAKDLRGKTVKLTAAVRVETKGGINDGHLWLRVDRENNEKGFFDNMNNSPIVDKHWKKYEIIGEVANDASKVFFGCFLRGEGSLWVDDFRLYVKNNSTWKRFSINNPDFESDQLFMPPKDWDYTREDYSIGVSKEEPFNGKKCVLIESNLRKQLFDKFALPGTIIRKYLSQNLICYIPISLYSNNDGTLPNSDRLEFVTLQKSLDSIQEVDLNGGNVYARLANIAIVWNIIQHFYPYFELYDIDWNERLPKYLEKAYNDKSELDFLTTLDELMAEINDGHAGAYLAGGANKLFFPPIVLDYAESKIVVSKFLAESTGLKEGDIVESIDGKEISGLIEAGKYKISSATDQWKMSIIVSHILLSGPEGSIINLKVLRGSEELSFSMERRPNSLGKVKGVYPEYRPGNIEEMRPGILYLNLTSLTSDEIEAVMPQLVKSKGLILDIRGYPWGNDALITHLIDKPITSARWMVPQIIYPDRENIVGYDTSGRWNVMPEKPRLNAKVVYLTNGSAISYAESLLGIIEYYKLGDIVGEPTAGTNGNVNTISLLGGYKVTWTGMKVIKHDGSQHHGIGIQPTYPVHRTLKGVKEKRDEFVEKAIDIIEKNVK